jgi:hypothetical protein
MEKTQKERLATLETLVPTILEKLTAMDAKMDGLDHVIRGNGAPGLAAKVDAIKTRVETIEGGRNRWRDAFFTVAGGITVGVSVFLFSQSWSDRHVKQANQSVPAMQQKP